MIQPQEKRIVLGIGAGQCGLNLLGEILARQPETRITFEEPPQLPWVCRAGAPGIRERIARWRATRAGRFIGDMAHFYLPYIEAAIACEPGVRIVCLRRDRDEVVSAIGQYLNDNAPLPIDHWSSVPADGWYHDPLWSPTYPKYDTGDRAEGIARYWSEYYERAADLARRYPDNVLMMEAADLTGPEGVRRALTFVGIDPGRQVMVTGQPPPRVLSAEEVAARVPKPADSFDPRSCAVLVPFYGSIHQECDAALKELERRGYRVFRVGGYAAIDQARNQLATDALIHGFAETMWIDSDIGFHPDDVEKLRRHRLPIVSGIYPQKAKRTFACEFLPDTRRVTFGKGGGLLEILYAGTGFLLIRREAYTAIQEKLGLPVCNDRFKQPTIPFFEPMVRTIEDGHWYLAEDFSFCERARQCGYRIHADTSIRLWHIGTYRYGWEDAGLVRAHHESFTLNATNDVADLEG